MVREGDRAQPGEQQLGVVWMGGALEPGDLRRGCGVKWCHKGAQQNCWSGCRLPGCPMGGRWLQPSCLGHRTVLVIFRSPPWTPYFLTCVMSVCLHRHQAPDGCSAFPCHSPLFNTSAPAALAAIPGAPPPAPGPGVHRLPASHPSVSTWPQAVLSASLPPSQPGRPPAPQVAHRHFSSTIWDHSALSPPETRPRLPSLLSLIQLEPSSGPGSLCPPGPSTLCGSARHAQPFQHLWLQLRGLPVCPGRGGGPCLLPLQSSALERPMCVCCVSSWSFVLLTALGCKTEGTGLLCMLRSPGLP